MNSSIAVVRRMAALLLVMLVTVGLLLAKATAAQAETDPASHRIATWNMAYGRNNWQRAYALSRTNDVVALQEVPREPPAAARFVGTVGSGTIRAYTWREGSRGVVRNLYILRTPSRNLGMITSFRPNAIFRVGGPYRPALVVGDFNSRTVFASVHASARGGGDAPALINALADYAGNAYYRNWVMAGDFNRSPQSLFQAPGFPDGVFNYSSGRVTQRSGNELDYMISNVHTEDWQASVLGTSGSDHFPVQFGSLRAGGATVTLSGDSSRKLVGLAFGVPRNGSHVIIGNDGSSNNQTWSLRVVRYDGSSPVYRLVNTTSNRCLDVDNGPNSTANSQLNVWDCHPNGALADTQNWGLGHPDFWKPNVTLLYNYGTHLYMNVWYDLKTAGTPLIQWYWQPSSTTMVAANEEFHPHP